MTPKPRWHGQASRLTSWPWPVMGSRRSSRPIWASRWARAARPAGRWPVSSCSTAPSPRCRRCWPRPARSAVLTGMAAGLGLLFAFPLTPRIFSLQIPPLPILDGGAGSVRFHTRAAVRHELSRTAHAWRAGPAAATGHGPGRRWPRDDGTATSVPVVGGGATSMCGGARLLIGIRRAVAKARPGERQRRFPGFTAAICITLEKS